MHILTEFGMGTSLRRGDYTEAARRGLRDALWRNSINAAEVMGRDKTDMRLDVVVGVQRPEKVDRAALRDVFPYGTPHIDVRYGGLDVARPNADGPPTIIAQVAISVLLSPEREA